MYTRLDAEEWTCPVQESITCGKSAPAAPAAPDPAATAAAQTTADVNTASAQAALNDVNQVTPYGNLTYNQTGSYTTPGGQTVPQYTATTTLSPAQQQALDSEQSLTQSLYDTANNLSGQVGTAINTPINTSSLAPIPNNPQALDATTANAVYDEYKNLNAPGQAQQTQNEQDMLAHEGITPGNAAYETDMDNLQRTQAAANLSAQDQAVQTGASVAGQQFSQDLSANQAGLGEQVYLNELPLNESIALMGGGQIQNPNFVSTPQTGVAPTDVLGAYGLNQAAQNTAYQGAISTQNSNMGAGAGLAGAAITAAIF